MRKFFALSTVALLALTLAIAALGCGKKEEAPAASGSMEQSSAPADTAAKADTSAMSGGGAMDTTHAAK